MGLSAKLLTNKSGVSSQVDALNSYTSSSNLVERDSYDYNTEPLYVSTDWKPSALTLSASSLTVTSLPANHVALQLFTRKSSSGRVSSVARTNFGGWNYGLSSTETSYLTSLASSELGSHGLWFASALYQLVKYGSWNCQGVESLLSQYNLTGDASEEVLDGFFGDLDLQYNTTGSFDDLNVTSILQTLGSQSDISELESKLLISLSSDCTIKKSSVGLNVIGWLVYLYTSGKLVSSAIALFSQLKSAREKAESKDEQEESQSVELLYDRPSFFPKLRKQDLA
ncbi:unnamed protein product [Kuraishia capsulata CBS 1993]|uniref:Uncharacterized protein n=1 Tax=Kuraishia capsulata CBS 1993 TaxID=1382522 RepID=W6MQ38_9ASCO|nr:uncharacterized protein KUCA_T00003340001 [Kuraishia capsulata CBS 1993]CDK27362.1 unnamed protein product [Kuraishia capsulata CBS 1993]